MIPASGVEPRPAGTLCTPEGRPGPVGRRTATPTRPVRSDSAAAGATRRPELCRHRGSDARLGIGATTAVFSVDNVPRWEPCRSISRAPGARTAGRRARLAESLPMLGVNP